MGRACVLMGLTELMVAAWWWSSKPEPQRLQEVGGWVY